MTWWQASTALHGSCAVASGLAHRQLRVSIYRWPAVNKRQMILRKLPNMYPRYNGKEVPKVTVGRPPLCSVTERVDQERVRWRGLAAARVVD
jgi:hypothetical protein